MTIEKAIEILTELSMPGSPDLEPGDFAAIKLGIEALQCIKQARRLATRYYTAHLPGETKE